MVLSKEGILGSSDLPRELVKVPEWGGDVFVGTMTGAERDGFEAGVNADKESGDTPANVRARLAVIVVRDEAGKRIFSDADAESLGNKSCAALDRVWDVAARINRMRKEDVEAAEKN